MARGLSNKEIARRLALSTRTVETHVEHVLRKLDVPTRSRAVSEAVKVGFVSTTESVSRVDCPNNLPFQLTTLLGRDRDLAGVISSLEKNRLVTLSGSGGVGKTRLALSAGFDVLADYPDGVWFCDFSSLSDPELIVGVVAKVLAVRDHSAKPLIDSIIRTLKHRRVLLILDNCEHVLNAVADLADETLRRCPNVRVLATSRQPLGIIGEVVCRLPSLDVPRGVNPSPDDALSYGAVALFVERARSLNHQFALSSRNASCVTEICRRLDGIPLAIELAAARVGFTSVDGLARSLDDRFSVLTGGGRTDWPRHRTLRASIDWSYNLLSPLEQQLFRRLGIFAGSFSLPTATVVCLGDAATTPNERDSADLLAALIDKSLVGIQMAPGQERYALLETMRSYALDKLRVNGECEMLSRCHADVMLDIAERLSVAWQNRRQAFSFDQEAHLELPNWRAALEWAFGVSGDVRVGASIVGALGFLWCTYHEVEGLRWIKLAIEAIDEHIPIAVRARLEHTHALVRLSLTHHKEFLGAAERAWTLYERLDDPLGVAGARAVYAHALMLTHRVAEAEVMLQDVLAVARSHKAHGLVGQTLQRLASTRFFSGDTIGARTSWLEALAELETAGDSIGISEVALNLAETEFARGDSEEALRFVDQALSSFRSLRAAGGVANALRNAAAYLIALGRLDEARSRLHESLALAREMRLDVGSAIALQHIAAIAALRQESDGFRQRESRARAARLLGFVDALFAECTYERQYTERQEYHKIVSVLRAAMTDRQFSESIAEGSAWSEERAVAEALAV